jgi:hypothetical protein
METLQLPQILETDVLPRLASYQMLPQFQRECIIDEVIAPILCTEEELAKACQQFYAQNQLTNETIRQD